MIVELLSCDVSAVGRVSGAGAFPARTPASRRGPGEARFGRRASGAAGPATSSPRLRGPSASASRTAGLGRGAEPSVRRVALSDSVRPSGPAGCGAFAAPGRLHRTRASGVGGTRTLSVLSDLFQCAAGLEPASARSPGCSSAELCTHSGQQPSEPPAERAPSDSGPPGGCARRSEPRPVLRCLVSPRLGGAARHPRRPRLFVPAIPAAAATGLLSRVACQDGRGPARA